MWDKAKLMEEARKQVNPARFHHIMGVVETARLLAAKYGVDVDKAEVAAILHDYCKSWSKEQLQGLLLAHEDSAWLNFPHQTWHAPAAFYVVQQEFGITDGSILDAIYYHTTGKAQMTTIAKVIWVADYIEPHRHFVGVEQARVLAEDNIDDALSFGLSQTILHLVERKQSIHPLTVEAYNYYHTRR